MSRMNIRRVPPNWGLAPNFGDDLLYEGPVSNPKLSQASRARAIGAPIAMLDAHYSDTQVAALSRSQWDAYKRVLRSRGQGGEIKRLSHVRSIADERAKCPGKWNPKTGCRPRKWYHEARDTGRHAVQTVARSPITRGALAVAAFTPLAPIAVPVGAGLTAADRLMSGQGLDVGGLSEVAAAAVGVPPGAVPVTRQLGKLAQGELDAVGLSEVAASAVGVPPGAVRVGSKLARGDVQGLSAEAARAVGVPPGAVPIASSVARGDLKGAARRASRYVPGVADARELARTAKHTQRTVKRNVRAVRNAPRDILRAGRRAANPSPRAVSSLLRRRW